MSAENLGLASAAVGGVWGVLGTLAHLPPAAAGSAAAAVGALAGAQAIRAKWEARRNRRRRGGKEV